VPAAVCEDFGLAFFSVPKAASTSMKMVLYELNNGRPWTNEPDSVHPIFPTHPITEEDFQAVDSFWRYTIIRDPIARLLSAYGNRVHHHRDIQRDVAAQGWGRRFRLRQYRKLPDYPTPTEFYCHLTDYQALSYSILHHTASITRFIGSDLSRFDAIFPVDDLGRLERELSERTGRAIVLPRVQTGDQKLTMDMLPREARRAVLDYTADDYDLLQDWFPRPSNV